MVLLEYAVGGGGGGGGGNTNTSAILVTNLYPG